MINEERVKIKGEINIGATISYPDKNKKYPLVILIAGTGGLDRDGNALGFKTNLYKDLSDMFVELDCVCIRYDKRGTYESKTKNLNFGLSDYVDDVSAIINYAKKLDYIDSEKIIICGHSEGAMIATLLTQKENLHGIILLAGACMGLRDASIYQNYLIIDEVKNMKGLLGWFLRKVIIKEKIEKQINEMYLKADACQKDKFFFNGAILPTKYVREHGRLSSEDYIKILRAYKGRILAITGRSDVQADYRKLDSIKDMENALVYTPDKLNHMLRDVDDELSIMNVKKEYKKCFKKGISRDLKNKIESFIEEVK